MTTTSEWGYITCHECGREFDLTDGPDADEWHHGHDCEPDPASYPDRCRVRLPAERMERAAFLTRIAAYLPSGWRVDPRPMGPLDNSGRVEFWAVITGEDFAGWTLEDYVMPRLASGLIFPEPMPGGAF